MCLSRPILRPSRNISTPPITVVGTKEIACSTRPAPTAASLPAPKAPAKPKKGAKAEDPAQPIFEFATEESMRRGLFGGTPMTFIDGQDVDVPAYIRKAVRLPPAP